MNIDLQYMSRAIQLACISGTYVQSNPNVGCVIVHNDRIIGEGWHQKYGEAHAEINAIYSIQVKDRHLIPESVVYVTLEPCAHQGKTPSCTHALVDYGFKKVVIGCTDPNSQVNGEGIRILKHNNVSCDVLQFPPAIALIRDFAYFIENTRPYICLKWAQSFLGFMGEKQQEIAISSEKIKRIVHRWRSEFQGILIGPNTVIADNPTLNNRLFSGNSPIPIIIDRFHRIPEKAYLLQNDATLYVTTTHRTFEHPINQIIVDQKKPKEFLHAMLTALADYPIKSILVEGGREILMQFIIYQLWQECRVIHSPVENPNLNIYAPSTVGSLHSQQWYDHEYIQHFFART